jgi:hypothetical protein
VAVKKVGGFRFITYTADHPPLHVHIFEDEKYLGRWDIEHQCPMKGDDFVVTKRLRKALRKAGYLREEP